jgi:hypothetical protein
MRQFIIGVVVFGAAAGMLACASSTDGAGNADPTENVGASEAALTPASCPSGYGLSTTTLPFDTFTSRCGGFVSPDYDNSMSVPMAFRFYFTGFAGSDYFGAECGGPPSNHHYIEGISSRTSGVFRAHAAKCSTRTHGVGNPAATYYLSRSRSTFQSGIINDPTTSQVGFDWDPGSIKAECGFHQVVTGLGQTESNEIDAISCSPANVTTGTTSGTCKTVKFVRGDNCLDGCSGSGDWNPGFFKTMCRSSQYVKGVSKNVSGGLGEINAILCCNW